MSPSEAGSVRPVTSEETQLTAYGIAATRALLGRGERTATEHLAAHLAAIEEHDPGLGAFVAVAGEEALRAAAAADARLRALGPAAFQDQPLLGVPVSVKDLIQTGELPTRRGSLLPNRRPAADAPAVARLKAAGAIVVGKTTTSEYGWSASTVSRVSPPTRNPWDPAYSAGGSSGGAAASVAAGLCTAALGTDGAGSIRIPAAFCGVVGYKPSFGRVPYVPAGADRLSHLGPLARSVEDVMEIAAVLPGPHRQDPDSGLGALESRPERRGLRVGWIEFPGTAPEVRRVSERALEALAALGHHPERIEVPFRDPYPALLDILAAAEAAGAAPGDEADGDPGRLAVVRHGRGLDGAAVMRAEEVRMELRTRLAAVMERHDLLAMATVPVEPFAPEAIGPDWASDPESLLWLAWSPATYPFNMTGQPALSLPAGLSRAGLPVGVQLVGPVGADALVLDTARDLEAGLGPLPEVPQRVSERML
ncbi:amidase [Streptomyces physcomitrii]|uniref:Amidase n=1 Tax=Streptomyces physcomitrii TaxID=2724184 RepID=A0ABX1H5R5_9ACTN|nr:amidase family protein [Streptomyces physcomitrii]NKI42640.1 amidase [Streptomyces physcomitrii]